MRSRWKLPFFETPIKMRYRNGSPRVISRSATIIPSSVGLQLFVYTGKNIANFKVTQDIVGYKVGEFIRTRGRYQYKKIRKNKK